MANHKSALKRIRSNEKKRLRNRYQLKATRAMVKKVRNSKNKAEASQVLNLAFALLDRLARKNVIHKNKASNNKSKLAKFVNKLAA